MARRESDGPALSLQGAADYLGVSRSTVYEYCQVYADFPVVKLSRRTWRIPVDQLEAWLASRIGLAPANQTRTISAAATMRRVREQGPEALHPHNR